MDKLFLFLDNQIPELQKQGDANSLQILEQLNTFKTEIQNLLDQLVKQGYNKERCFLTPHLMNEEVKQLGEFLKLETSEKSANEFHQEINKVNDTKEELKNNILKLTETEKHIEDDIVSEALERLRKYKEFVLLIGKEISECFELATEINLFHQNQAKLATLSEDKIKEEKQRAKESYASGRRLLFSLTRKAKLAEKFESEAGIPFDEDKHIVRGSVENNDPSKNQTIYKSLSPGLKMGEEVIVPERVIYYANA